MSRIAGVAALGGAAAAAIHALLIRPRLRWWGATDEEVHRPLPGDDLVPGSIHGATNAITIGAPASEVWPWLVQMGCQRAGWYSYDRLDNGGVPSADRIVPDLQHLKVDDFVPSTPSGRLGFTVAAIEPPRTLVFRATLLITSRGPVMGTPDDVSQRNRYAYVDSTWAFVLDELDAGTTRLIVRTRAAYRPRLWIGLFNLLVGEPAHFVMQRKQLLGIKQRAEAAVTSR